MKIDGSCHCGNITYAAEIDLENVGICHCTEECFARNRRGHFAVTGKSK